MPKVAKKTTGVRVGTGNSRKSGSDLNRTKSWVLAGAFVLVFGGIGAYLVSLSNAATAPTVVAPVYTSATHPYIGLTKMVTLKANQKAYLYTTPLIAKVTSWGTGKPTNVGTSTSIICTNSAGVVKVNATHGQNIVRSEIIRPMVRAMLDPGAAGTYRCKLVLYAYSTVAAPGMKAALYPLGGYASAIQVSLSDGDGNATWADTRADSGGHAGYSLNPNGTVINYLQKTLPIPRAATTTSWFVVVDSMISTCTRLSGYPPLCNASSTGVASSTVQTQILIQPTKADGSSCGTNMFTSTAVKTIIPDATHHRTTPNSVSLSGDTLRALPTACTVAKIKLQAKVMAGDYAVAHTGYNYSHAFAFVVK